MLIWNYISSDLSKTNSKQYSISFTVVIINSVSFKYSDIMNEYLCLKILTVLKSPIYVHIVLCLLHISCWNVILIFKRFPDFKSWFIHAAIGHKQCKMYNHFHTNILSTWSRVHILHSSVTILLSIENMLHTSKTYRGQVNIQYISLNINYIQMKINYIYAKRDYIQVKIDYTLVKQTTFTWKITTFKWNGE